MTSVIKGTCVVDSDDGRCSAVGRDILLKGGNAVDAAVAVTLCLGVTNAGSSGVGGGSFMLVRMNDGRVQGFNMRDKAPSGVSEAMYQNNPQLKSVGPLSICVPGELKGLHKAWEMFGSKKPNLQWKDLVAPAIKLAEGCTISPYLYSQMQKVKDDILNDPGLSKVYTSNGKLLNAGDVYRNEQLANTLRAIAENGSDELYTGNTAIKLARDLNNFGSLVTKSDLANYQVELVLPLKARTLDHEFLTMPLPASGGAGMVLLTHILELYAPFGKGQKEIDHHRFIEAVKHMMAVKTHLGDPDFAPQVNVVVSDMLSPEFAKELKAKISDDRTYKDPYYYGGRWHIQRANESQVIKDHGTSHMSIVDEARNSVALTTSVNYYFGSRYMSPSTGILLNNQMDDFTLSNNFPAYPNNRIQPNKRPLSSMGPSILLKDGKLSAVVGSSGGWRIIIGTAQVLLNHYAWKMDLMPSIMNPRLFHEFIPDNLEVENWTTPKKYKFYVPENTRTFLKNKGHNLSDVAENNMCQFLVLSEDEKYITGVSDPRKGSYPAGYIKQGSTISTFN